MIKNPAYRFTAIFMAFLLLLSATGFSMDLHYCQNQLKGLSLIGKAKSCHEKRATMTCHKEKMTCQHHQKNDNQAEKDNCCHNEKVVVKSNDTDATSPQTFVQPDLLPDFIATFNISFVFNYQIEKEIQSYLNFKPPLPTKDYQNLYQVFLI